MARPPLYTARVQDDTYRYAASMLLFRTEEGVRSGGEILLLHKPRKKDAWQLPQGGMEEGETAEQCAIRELKEEAGLDGVRMLGKSSAVYQYDFPASYRRFRPDHICGQRIEFVYAVAPPDAVVTVDDQEVDRYQWVKPDQLPRFLKRKEYFELVRHLLEEAREHVSA